MKSNFYLRNAQAHTSSKIFKNIKRSLKIQKFAYQLHSEDTNHRLADCWELKYLQIILKHFKILLNSRVPIESSITMKITVTNLAELTFELEVAEDLELENFKAFCEVQSGLPGK